MRQPMGSFSDVGKALVVIGLLTAAVGVVCLAAPRLPWLGRLPGDIVIRRENWTLYVPLGTCLLISVALSFVLWFFGRR